MSMYVQGARLTPHELPAWTFILVDSLGACAAALSVFFFFHWHYPRYSKEEDDFGAQIFDRLRIRLPASGPFQHRHVAAAALLYAFVAVVAAPWMFFSRKVTVMGYIQSFGDCLG